MASLGSKRLGASTLRAGLALKSKQGFDNRLSKIVELNNNYRLFMRVSKVLVDEDAGTYVIDPMVPTTPGRPGDWEIIGTSFIPFNSSQVEFDETDNIIDLTGLNKWARIARVLFEAQCTREKKAAEAEQRRVSEETGRPLDAVALKDAIEGIELKYHGGKAANGKKINPDKSPAIGSIVYKMTAQVLVVKLDATSAPDWNGAQCAVWELSKSRAEEIINICSTLDYVDEENMIVELGYSYTGSDKKSAGQNASLQGIADSLSLRVKYPDLWESVGKNKIDMLVKGATDDATADLIASRNANLSGRVSPTEAIVNFKKWCSDNAATLASIDLEADITKAAAPDFLENHLLDTVPKIKANFEKLVAENASKDAPTEAPATSADDENLKIVAGIEGTATKTLSEVMSAVGTNDSLIDDGTDEL